MWRLNAVLVPCPAGQPNSLLGGQEAVRAGAVPVVPDDVAARIDATAERSDRAGDVNRREGAVAQDKRVRHTRTRILPDDITARIDVPSLCGGGTGDIDRRERAIAQEIAVFPAAINVGTHDVARVVDPKREGLRRTRDINRGERPVVEHETVIDASRVYVVADHLFGVIDPEHPSNGRAGEIHFGERTLLQQEATGRGGGPIVGLSDDVARKPCAVFVVLSVEKPTMSPRALMPCGAVFRDPGTSIVVKVNARATSGIPIIRSATRMALLPMVIAHFPRLATRASSLWTVGG